MIRKMNARLRSCARFVVMCRPDDIMVFILVMAAVVSLCEVFAEMRCTHAKETARALWTRNEEINAKLADTRNALKQR